MNSLQNVHEVLKKTTKGFIKKIGITTTWLLMTNVLVT